MSIDPSDKRTFHKILIHFLIFLICVSDQKEAHLGRFFLSLWYIIMLLYYHYYYSIICFYQFQNQLAFETCCDSWDLIALLWLGNCIQVHCKYSINSTLGFQMTFYRKLWGIWWIFIHMHCEIIIRYISSWFISMCCPSLSRLTSDVSRPSGREGPAAWGM